jgi:predicted enzyme related to lactoylglutathione lyase
MNFRFNWLLLVAMIGAVSLPPCATGAPAQPPLPPLTSVSGSPRLTGKFVWADLVTDNVPAALAFYKGLFGWTFQDFGGYAIAANDGRPLCGVFHRARPAGRTDTRPRWFAYISVSDVAEAGRAVFKGGGRVLAVPQKLPKRGEQAVFADPEGAVFGVIRSSSGDPEDFLADPGDWIWIQLLSRNARKAAEFYKAVAGYELLENSSSNRLSDYVLASEGYARATVRTIASAKPQVQPTWLPFVRVKSINETTSAAIRLGGKVLIEPKPELFNGKVAVVADPTGAAIGVLEWDKGSLKGSR